MIDLTLDTQTDRVDWSEARRLLREDDFDNGRSPEDLRRSYENSQHVVYARTDGQLVGMARMLSDGICNTYLLDVWTSKLHRRQGIGSRMVGDLLERVPGHHVGLQTDDARGFYRSLGFQEQPIFMSTVVGTWLDHDPH